MHTTRSLATQPFSPMTVAKGSRLRGAQVDSGASGPLYQKHALSISNQSRTTSQFQFLHGGAMQLRVRRTGGRILAEEEKAFHFILQHADEGRQTSFAPGPNGICAKPSTGLNCRGGRLWPPFSRIRTKGGHGGPPLQSHFGVRNIQRRSAGKAVSHNPPSMVRPAQR